MNKHVQIIPCLSREEMTWLEPSFSDERIHHLATPPSPIPPEKDKEREISITEVAVQAHRAVDFCDDVISLMDGEAAKMAAKAVVHKGIDLVAAFMRRRRDR